MYRPFRERVADGPPERDARRSPGGPESSRSPFAFSTGGEERWRYESSATMLHRPVLADGAVHVVTGWHGGYSGTDTRLVRVAADGSTRWSTAFGIPGPLAVFGDTLYLDAPAENENGDYPLVAVDATTLVAVDATTGESLRQRGEAGAASRPGQ